MARGRGGLFLHLNPSTHPILIPNFENHPQVDSTSFRLAPNLGLFGLTGVGRLTLRDCGRREPPERSTSKGRRRQFVWLLERWVRSCALRSSLRVTPPRVDSPGRRSLRPYP